MPSIVQPALPHAGLPQQGLPGVIVGAGIDRSTDLVREYAVAIGPQVPRRFALTVLAHDGDAHEEGYRIKAAPMAHTTLAVMGEI